MIKNKHLDRLRQKASLLPKRPGVYLMKDADGQVIYVGKSKTLKNRVSQYFQSTFHGAKTDRMVSNVFDFDYILCDTEIEALALENSKIKQLEPRYNIKLKDDKSYPYILLTNEEYPTLVITRSRVKGKGVYFGPYSSGQTARQIVKTVGRIYGIPSCKKVFPRDIGKSRPCLNSQIGRCCGVCTGRLSSNEYKALIDGVQSVLKGDISEAKKMLNEKMLSASESLAFEAAAKYRDRISALEALYKNQKVVASSDVNCDVIGIHRSDAVSIIAFFFIRGGIIFDTQSYSIGAYALDGDEELESFICGIYEQRGQIPKEILISDQLFSDNDSNSIKEYLSSLRGSNVNVVYPMRGEKAQLCRLVCDNAKQKALQFESEAMKSDRVLVSLAKALALEIIPERIEAYDISNYGNDNITAGMIVSENASLKKSAYRIFNIKSTDIQDDYASMHEVLSRRLDSYEAKSSGFEKLPDLILLDGGSTHTRIIRRLFEERGYNVPIFGMVKDDYHKTRALTNGYEEISLSRTDELFIFLYKLQEEVHRFTIGKMKQAKRKSLKTSSLTAINGVGEKKALALLEHFESLDALKKATAEQLEEVKGINRKIAESIISYFSENK